MRSTILLFATAALLAGCAGVGPQPSWKAEQYFHYAMEMFNEEDYFEAAREFKVVTLRYAGSQIGDSAQFYLAESHYHMSEYIIAASEYEKLINNMSHSKLLSVAQFKLAQSYYQLSPRSALDQKFTKKAIQEFQNFVEEYPTDRLKEDAEKRIEELRDKLAKKEYNNGEIYRKMRRFSAANIYYDMVLGKYYDTQWADDALFGKINAYIDHKKYLSAHQEIDKFLSQFPNSDIINDVRETKQNIAENLVDEED